MTIDEFLANCLYIYYVITQPEIEFHPSYISARTPVLLFLAYVAYQSIKKNNRRADKNVQKKCVDQAKPIVEEEIKKDPEDDTKKDPEDDTQIDPEEDTKKDPEDDTKKDAQGDAMESGEEVKTGSNEGETESDDDSYSHGSNSDTTEAPDSDEIFSDDDTESIFD